MEHATSHHSLPCIDFWGWTMSHGGGGVLLMVAGLWWAGNVLSNFYASIAPSGGQPFRSQMHYPGPIGNILVEGWCFLLIPGALACQLSVGGLLAPELFGVLHVGIFFGFAAFGVVELLIHHQVLLPEGFDTAMFLVAFYLKALLTYTHLDGTSSPVILAHSFVVLNEVLIILATLLERSHRDSVVCAMARPYLVLVDGAWLIYIAARFAGCSHASLEQGAAHQAMGVIAAFTWLYLISAAVMMLIAWWSRRQINGSFSQPYKMLRSEVA